MVKAAKQLPRKRTSATVSGKNDASGGTKPKRGRKQKSGGDDDATNDDSGNRSNRPINLLKLNRPKEFIERCQDDIIWVGTLEIETIEAVAKVLVSMDPLQNIDWNNALLQIQAAGVLNMSVDGIKRIWSVIKNSRLTLPYSANVAVWEFSTSDENLSKVTESVGEWVTSVFDTTDISVRKSLDRLHEIQKLQIENAKLAELEKIRRIALEAQQQQTPYVSQPSNSPKQNVVQVLNSTTQPHEDIGLRFFKDVVKKDSINKMYSEVATMNESTKGQAVQRFMNDIKQEYDTLPETIKEQYRKSAHY